MTPIDLELQLHQHGSALRSLARDLTGDASSADDLVQATVQHALDRPPERPGPLGGWLATILRRLHLQQRRGERRRQARELDAARHERLPSTDEQVARREILRLVTAAVFELDEPYQTAVLLRYFSDLSPAEIAARTATSVATVKSRLQRALRLLRGRLDRHSDGSRRWMAALCAATGSRAERAVPLLSTTGVLLMGSTTKLALAGVLVVLTGAVAWGLLDRNRVPAGGDVPRDDAPATTTRTATAAPATEPVSRDVVAAPATAPDEAILDHPFTHELEVRVVDRLGLPVPNAVVLLAPSGCRLDQVAERTDDEGFVRVSWQARAAAMAVVVATRSSDVAQAMHAVTSQAGTPTQLVLGGSRRTRATFRLVPRVSGGGSLELVQSGGNGKLGPALSLAIEGIVLQESTFGGNPQMRAGRHPFASFADVQWSERPAETAQAPRFTAGSASFSFEMLTTAARRQSGDDGERHARIEGIVYGEDGRPCARCPVAWGNLPDRPSGRTETDGEGAFRFERVPEGTLHLRAGGGDDGLQRLTVSTLKDQTSRVDVQLKREATARGRVVPTSGDLAGDDWRIEWVGVQTPWFDACDLGDDGTFVMPNLPGGAGDLLLWRDTDAGSLPLVRVPNVRPDTGEVEIRYDPSTCRGELRIEPLLPDGTEQGSVEARIVQEETGRGAPMSKLEHGNQFGLGGLAAGWYRVEIGGPGLGWVDAGRHWVDGRGLVDVGRVPLPGSGTVRIDRPEHATVASSETDGVPDVEIYDLRDDCDVRVEPSDAITEEPLRLPVGDYLVFWRTAAGTTEFEQFSVHANREVEIDCDRR